MINADFLVNCLSCCFLRKELYKCHWIVLKSVHVAAFCSTVNGFSLDAVYRTNLPSILSTIAARCHSFFGNIRCLPANTPAHKALKLAVDSKSRDITQHDWNRPAGRPRTTWMSQIVRDTGLTAADAWALADDRSTWRALRPTAGYAQQWVSEWVKFNRPHYVTVYCELTKSNKSDARIT